MSYEFADRLIELRREKGLSQEDLAGRLGISRQAISKWERAESVPDVGNLVALSELYGMSLDRLVRGLEAEKEALSGVEGADEEPELTVDAIAAESHSETESAEEVEAGAATVEQQAPSSNPTSQFQPQLTSAPQPAATPASQPTVTPVPQPAVTHRTSKAWRIFPYPLLCVVVFLFLGFFFGLWHPAWIIFITIPFYYWVVYLILHDPNYIRDHETQVG